MFTRIIAVLVMAAAGILGLLASGTASGQTMGAEGYTFSGPFTHDNLNIFLIHGPDAIKGRTYLSLQEAMEQKKLTVYETGEVNELQVENLSDTEDVYIQAGDIVKGGKQDRTFGADLIVQAKSGKVPIASFCVESGRWTQRANEDAGAFSASSNAISGNGLKLSAAYAPQAGGGAAASQPAAGQSAVWANVAEQQRQLSMNAGERVNAEMSASSLQLALENKKVREIVDQYLKELRGSAEGKKDAIGFAVVINGKVKAADVYASNALFEKMWPKMIDAAATQALAELEKGKTYDAVTAAAVKQFMASTDGGKESRREVSGRVEMVQKDAEKAVKFDTLDRGAMPAAGGMGGGRGRTVHESWVGK